MARTHGGHRHSDDDGAGIFLVDRLHGGTHRRAGGEAIVDQDHGLARKAWEWPVAAVLFQTAIQLLGLALGDRANDMRWNVVGRYDIPVQHFHAVAGNSPHRQLRVPRHAELADDEYIQRTFQFLGNFKGYRNAAARQRQHDHVVIALVTVQLLSQ